LILYVNGELLWDVRDDALASGWIVPRASAEGGAPFAAEFDNLIVWDIGN
jgi:hypothetical protein